MKTQWYAVCIIFGVVGLSGCKESDGQSDGHQATGWHIMHPNEYEHLQDPRDDEVAQWLQGRPYVRSFAGSYIRSPYTFEEWVERGRRMPGIERTLLDFYTNYSGQIVRISGIFEALGYVGTYRSVPTLIDAFEDEYIDNYDKRIAVSTLAKIGDPRAVQPMIQWWASSKHVDPKAKYPLVHNVIGALLRIGDPRAIPIIGEMIREADDDVKSKEYFLKCWNLMKKDQGRYAEDWVLRWHLGNKTKNSRRLPYFRSEKEWIKFGREIPGLDKLLLELYRKGNKRVSDYSLFHALEKVGTPEVVPGLIEVFLDADLNFKDRHEVGIALRTIDPENTISLLLTRISGMRFEDEEYEMVIKGTVRDVYQEVVLDERLSPLIKRVIELEAKYAPMGI
ncbi:MAG: hypothetical protein V3V47_03565 [Desulfobacteria bacterium]